MGGGHREDACRVVGKVPTQDEDAHVKVMRDPALPVVLPHGRGPEEGGSAGDGVDAVERGGGIDHDVAGRELHRLGAVGVLDHKLSAAVIPRRREEEGGGRVRADAPPCAETGRMA